MNTRFQILLHCYNFIKEILTIEYNCNINNISSSFKKLLNEIEKDFIFKYGITKINDIYNFFNIKFQFNNINNNICDIEIKT